MRTQYQTIKDRLVKSLCYGIALAWLVGGQVSLAGEIELSDDVNLKLARLKAKNRQTIHSDKQDSVKAGNKQDELLKKNTGDCGVVDIGNIDSKKQQFGPQKVEVIIVGDVINAGNKC